jgi:hypothetical protein
LRGVAIESCELNLIESDNYVSFLFLPTELTKVDDKPERPEKPEKSEKPEKHDKVDPKQNDARPKKRTWELWSQEDKNTFFEALNEYGKDFDSIQNHFATKARKKGLGEHLIKNKDQVRHFYYRTWHKISKHLVFSDGELSFFML